MQSSDKHVGSDEIIRLRRAAVVEFTTKNLALTSAIVSIVGYLLGTVFLYSYLSFFDWRLIWLVEHADVIKFGIIAIAFFSSFTGLLWIVAADTAQFYKERGQRILVLFAILLILTSITIGIRLFSEYWIYAEPQYTFWMLVLVSPLLLFFTTVLLTRSFAGLRAYSASDIVADVSMVLTTATVLGLTFAVCVRDLGGFEQDITIEGKILNRVGIVLVTSHHTVLYSDGLSTIVPSSSISRIQSRVFVPRTRLQH